MLDWDFSLNNIASILPAMNVLFAQDSTVSSYFWEVLDFC